MELKVQPVNAIDSIIKNEIKNRKTNEATSFSAVMNEYTEKKKEEHTQLDFDSSSIKQLENLFDIDIEANKDKLVKDNGKLNILDIIDSYGDDLTGNDLRDFGNTVTALWKNGEIDDEDYYSAINWINQKVLEKSTELQVDDLKYKELDKITSNT